MMFDFNGDGHTDMTESFIAYQMIHDSSGNEGRSRPSSCRKTGGGGGNRATIALILIILAIIGWIYFIANIFVSCCSSSGKSSAGYSRSYRSNYGGSSYAYRSKTQSSAVQPTTKKSAYRSYSSKSSTVRSEDEYSVGDYADAEDFYYDHYDDFYDYEDAEDYYNEHAN